MFKQKVLKNKFKKLHNKTCCKYFIYIKKDFQIQFKDFVEKYKKI